MVLGKILENGNVIHEYNGTGFVFKDVKEFNNKSDKVCYVPEHGTTVKEGYTYKDLYNLAKKFIIKNKIKDTKVEDVTSQLFEDCQWESPETIIDQWEEFL